MRRKVTLVFVSIIFIMIMSIQITPIESSKDLFHYYVDHFQADTGAENAVTAIYLNYRLFDTFF